MLFSIYRPTIAFYNIRCHQIMHAAVQMKQQCPQSISSESEKQFSSPQSFPAILHGMTYFPVPHASLQRTKTSPSKPLCAHTSLVMQRDFCVSQKELISSIMSHDMNLFLSWCPSSYLFLSANAPQRMHIY